MQEGDLCGFLFWVGKTLRRMYLHERPPPVENAKERCQFLQGRLVCKQAWFAPKRTPPAQLAHHFAKEKPTV